MKKLIMIALIGIVSLSACKKEEVEVQKPFEPWTIRLEKLDVLRNLNPDRKVESFNACLVRGTDTLESFDFHYSVPYTNNDPIFYDFVNKGNIGDKIYIKMVPLGTFTWFASNANYPFMTFFISNFSVTINQSSAPTGYFNYEVTVRE